MNKYIKLYEQYIPRYFTLSDNIPDNELIKDFNIGNEILFAGYWHSNINKGWCKIQLKIQKKKIIKKFLTKKEITYTEDKFMVIKIDSVIMDYYKDYILFHEQYLDGQFVKIGNNFLNIDEIFKITYLDRIYRKKINKHPDIDPYGEEEWDDDE